MLTSLRLINFKNHEDTLIEGLKPLSVFVGPNAVGKSSILEGAHYIHQLGYKTPGELFAEGSRRAPERVARAQEQEFSIQANGSAPEGTWRAALSFSRNKNGYWQDELRIGPEGAEEEAQYKQHQGLTGATWVRRAVSRAVYFRFEPSRLKEPSYPESQRPRIEADGYGLASAVSHLMREEPEIHREIVERLRSIVPSVSGVRVTSVEIARRQRRKMSIEAQEFVFDSNDILFGDELLFDTVDKRGVPAAMQSDGTLFVLALITAMSLDGAPPLVLLDDIETGLHPKAQRDLVPLLKKLVGDGSRVQLLMTTHSPYIVDGLEPDEVWVCGRDKEERVRVKRLADLPGAKEALEVVTTGELWGEVGEDWVAGEA